MYGAARAWPEDQHREVAGVDDGQMLPDSATASVAFLARGGPMYVASERAVCPIKHCAARKGTARERGRNISPNSPRASRRGRASAQGTCYKAWCDGER
jgi:hypothetical protein